MADEPQRHRIQVACPECGHSQDEPALVVSTQCRACRANFQVLDGKGVKRSRPVTRLAKPRKETDPEPEPPPSVNPKTPLRFGPSGPPPRPLLMRLLRPAKPPREAICFTCEHAFTAIGEAHSSQCPKCGSYVSLIDHDITGHTKTRIQTRGNVLIRKTGSISGVTVRCHHLTVLGGLTSGVECSGDLVIRSHGKIPGTIQCRHLKVEKGAHVEFLHPVTAESATIDGEVRGQIYCSGSITLEKRARLHGLIRTSDLVVKSGAKHTGTVEMLSAKP
jgi:cytoskeletal protein CcmA (bactofilin family)